MSDYIAIGIVILIVSVLGVTIFMGDNGVKKSISSTMDASNSSVNRLVEMLNEDN